MGRIAGVSPNETKERLVDAAARIFERDGFEGATVAEIAKTANVSSGAIYAHYSTKAELLADALRSHGDRATSSLFPPGTRVDATGVLRTLATRLASRDRSNAALLTEALLAARRDGELAEILSDALADRQELMAAVVADGQATGVLTEEISPAVAARFALMLGLGSVLTQELDLPPINQAEWDAFVDRLINAFTKEDKL